MVDRKKSVNLLPEYFRTDKNAKFLSNTIDQLIQTPELERIDGYVGSKNTPNYNSLTDFYLQNSLPTRNNYSLEPALVFKNKKDKITDVISYDDVINELTTLGAKTDNLDKLLRSKFYSYDPLIDWDKLVNYNEYYWLPEGPDPILIDDEDLDVESDILNQISFTMSTGYKLSNGMKISFAKNTIQSEYREKTFIVEGVGASIKLINFDLLGGYEPMNTYYDETFDSDSFDNFPFDGDRRLPINPEYITINRSSKDLNPWSRYNRWFHKEIIEITGAINNTAVDLSVNIRASRPIIEFRPNIQLFNFGKTGILNVQCIDTTTLDAFTTVDGSFGYYVDGQLLQQGDRVIFNADTDDEVRGKIYSVSYSAGTSPILSLTEVLDPSELDSVAVNFGNTYSGTSWYFDSVNKKWIFAQQHRSLNEPPLFDLFDNSGISFINNAESNNFIGSKIFGYDIGTGVNDTVLGFPLKYKNSIGVGSYLFKNYFMTDVITFISNNVSTSLSTSVTYIKINNDDGTETLTNVWKENTSYRIPIVEVQTLSVSTSSITLTCLNSPIDTDLEVNAFVNNRKISSVVSATTTLVTVNFENPLSANDTVIFKIVSDQTPNSNGYYETPIGLSNNPLNGKIESMTLSELTDHVYSMTESLSEFTGTNLRDFSNYGVHGTQMIVNSNPISFAEIFLGKKEHNLIDAIRQAGINYNQFKFNLINRLNSIDSQLTPADALDIILKDINISRDPLSPYYRSDMLGYGDDKVVRIFTISNTSSLEFPIGIDFDLSRLSYQSVLVYQNDVQLIVGRDFTFDYVNGSVTLLVDTNINDEIKLCVYKNTLGCYIPPTPTKLGLYPKFEPVIFDDNTYASGSTTVIQGHDGSITKAFGDYRDDIIIEFEKRIFNNIKVTYNKNLFDINLVFPGAFRTTNYSLSNVIDILAEDFTRWAGTFNVDFKTNSTFDETNPFTWNYKNSYDVLNNNEVFGSWRNIFKYFFDTDRPHTHPWEMLGHTIKPVWWDTHYSWIFVAKRAALIDAITLGKTQEPPSSAIDEKYARPNFSSIVPVDHLGNLLSPDEFLVTASNFSDQTADWKIGDQSPAETAWRRSSNWPFVLNIAAILLDPCTYCSRLFDVSRTTINNLDQITYTEDDLYLDPRKLILDGEDNNSIAGYGVYVIEKGKNKSTSYLETLRSDLEYLNFNLFYKLGGFSSKDKLQVTIDSIDPVSTSPGVILPPENYNLILNVSNPIKSASISGIIIQRSNGRFVLKGYDVARPYFEILRPVKLASSGAVTVGGVSESFTEWANVVNNGSTGLNSIEKTTAASNSGRYYKQGQIIRFDGKFYRVKIGHNATEEFDLTLFQQLPRLPIKGGASAILPASYEKVSTRIPYGTSFSTIQEVYDVILGYGAWLETQGFIFDEYANEIGEVLDWKFTGKEFLFWSTQNWSNNNLITLSPFANTLKYQFTDSIVDNILSPNYEYSLLKADGKSYPIESFTLSREDGYCVINAKNENEGLFFATLNAVQKEHGIVFDNTTVFNDTIFELESGYRQARIKLSGFRTKRWNGDLYSPGFVYDAVDINDWQANYNYIIGDVVRYNGSYYSANVKIVGDSSFEFNKWNKLPEKPVAQLLPNFDYKITQFEDFYSLDIDNFDFDQQQLAQHLIGYTPRTYLNNVFTNPIAQYKFYQGFIKEKGTKNSIDKLSKATQSSNKGSIDFKEEWAFRVGNYGGFETFNEIEFKLNEGTNLENPFIAKFVNNVPRDIDPLIQYITPLDCLLTPTDYVSSSSFITMTSIWEDTGIDLLTAGYVRPDDVTATAYNKNSLLDIANNSIIKEGDTFWLGFLENGDWTVYRYSKNIARIAGVFISSPGIDITFTTDKFHGLSVGDIISVVSFNSQVDGVYKITGVPNLNQIKVASELTTIENQELLSLGTLFSFNPVRYSTFAEVSADTNIIKFKEGDKFWIDQGENSRWQVFEKIKNFTEASLDSNDYIPGQQLGYTVFAKDNTDVLMVSAPSWTTTGTTSVGRVLGFTRIDSGIRKDFEYALNNNDKIYCSSTTTEFGYSLSYDAGKKLYFAGAPAASNVRSTVATHGTIILSTGTETPKTFQYEGLVKISSFNEVFAEEITEFVVVNPYGHNTATATHARFGHSIYTNQVSTSSATLLLVGAPGDSISTLSGSVYAYSIEITGGTLSIDEHPDGINVVPTTTFSNGDRFGHSIVGSLDGTVIAISAPNYATTATNGIVEIFTNTATLSSDYVINSPFGANGNFGYSMAMSNSGKYLIVSSPEYKTLYSSYGQVAVYVNNAGTFELFQIIENPISYNDLKFGISVSISDDEETLVISSLGTKQQDTTFDSDETVFDEDTTDFFGLLDDAGEAYVYNKLGEYFVLADALSTDNVIEGSKFGNSVSAINNTIFVGAPTSIADTYPDDSRLFMFNKIDQTTNSWKVLAEQEDLIDVSKISRVVLIDSFKEEIADYLEIIDPVKGKISGIAEQELRYKSAFDPAIYSIGLAGTINDTNNNWLDEHVGDLWWDLSTAKYVWYEQSSDIFRKNNWGKLFPGATIDVYEWVKSDVLPSEWAALADTNEGLTQGISGQPKYPDNSIISVKQTYNNVTNSFENVYYFWVKNKVTIPNVVNRRISSYQVANIIADPLANGIKYIALLSKDSVAFANVQSMLSGNKINASISFDNVANKIPRHTEWILLTEGNYKDVPTALLEKKLFDSLLGHDAEGNLVPSLDLTDRNRYGLSIRPRQTLFKDRVEAIRNVTTFANSILAENLIVGNYSFNNLNKQEEIPDSSIGEYDYLVEDLDSLTDINTVDFERAAVNCVVSNGRIISVNILNQGNGYIYSPEIEISNNAGNAKLKSVVDRFGKLVSVEILNSGSNFLTAPTLTVRAQSAIVRVDSTSGNRWSKYHFDYRSNNWTKIKTQSYNTSLYWEYVNWSSTDFISYKNPKFTVEDFYELNSVESDLIIGDYVKIKNNGSGRFIILEKTISGNFSKDYNIVYSELGTIQILDSIWNYNLGKYSYDLATLEETLYDQLPDLELNYILLALRDNIFVGELKVNWNLLFFVCVKYALTEQKLLDWAFKTSFINVVNNLGTLDQRPVYKLENEEYFEDYIKEVKPYRTNIRNYTSEYSSIDTFDGNLTDFDLPAYYNTSTAEYITVDLGDAKLSEIPWKDWADNYKFFVDSIKIANGGAGYSQIPTIVINTAPGDTGSGAKAEAFIKGGKVSSIKVTNPGSGYVIPPTISIVGGGNSVTIPATASIIMGNSAVRKNIIGMRFDRTTSRTELVDDTVVDEFICPGNKTEFVLSWLADKDKTTIIPKLDGRLILYTDYTIEYFNEMYAGYNKKYSKFVFLNQVPVSGQKLTVQYEKSIDLFNAIDRIEKYYNPTEIMVGKEYQLLMSGLEYPETSIQGLVFTETPPWDRASYDSSPWDNLVSTYAEAKLIQPLTTSTTTLYLNTVSGITTGQSLVIVGTGSTVFRNDTVVESVDTLTNSVTITSPEYNLEYAYAEGSTITVKTLFDFYGNIRQGDIVELNGILTSGYNGVYEISTCSNNMFIVNALSTPANVTATITTSSTVRVYSILDNVSSTATLLDTVVEVANNTSTLEINSYALYSDVVTATVSVSAGGVSWSITTSTDIPPRAVISVSGLTTTTDITVETNLYGYTNIEFWSNTTDFFNLDTALSGGTWINNTLSGALGVAPEDINIDGDTFINPNSSFGPEEFVPGHTLDSVGINVYTQPDIMYPSVISGAIPIIANQRTSWPLFINQDNISGMIVYFNGSILRRSEYLPSYSYEYFIKGNSIELAEQDVDGTAFYTMIFAGSETEVESNYVLYTKTTSTVSTVVVPSKLGIIDVRSVYVTVNGVEISEYNPLNLGQFGYQLGPVTENNNRAAVTVYIPAEYGLVDYNVEVWFFKSKFTNFNRFQEESYSVTTSTTYKDLVYTPSSIEPSSAQVIVSIGSLTNRQRLAPPSVSYYKVQNGQSTFDIDNKNISPNVYKLSDINVYVNGFQLRPGFDFSVNSTNETVTVADGILNVDDVIAIEMLKNYDYRIVGNRIYFTNPLSNTNLQVISFANNSSMNIRTERFAVNLSKEYTLSLPVINQNYVWVSAGNRMLVGNIEFRILEDLQTIQITDLIDFDGTEEIVVTTVNPPLTGAQVVGYRLFKDIFGRQQFKRLSKYYTASLERPLSYTDTEIYVKHAENLAHPNPEKNLPGVVLIDGERIEYFTRNGNVLSQLRRSTLGTGPAYYSQIDTKVIDQSIKQSIQTGDYILEQHIPSSNTTTYVISTSTLTFESGVIGNGITLVDGINPTDQVEVYYGGRQLRKTSLVVHNSSISYDTTPESITILEPEFYINTTTQEIILNTTETISEGTRITVIQRKGKVWTTSTESLLESNIPQAVFLRSRPAELPDSYYYGGELYLTDENYTPLTDDSGNPLEGL